MHSRMIWAIVCLSLYLAIATVNRGRLSADDTAAPETPTLPVSMPIERQVTDYSDFTGATKAVESVKIISRVTGYVTSMPFREGSEVKRGELLFEIDPRPYQAQLDQADREFDLRAIRLKQAKTENARAKELAKTAAISQSEVDRCQAAEQEAIAYRESAKASVEIYKLNLGYCKVTSPIDGQVGQALLTPGNLAKQDETPLTTVVSLDPQYVCFEIDERTLLQIRRAINDGRMKPLDNGALRVSIELPDETGYPHQGKIDFVNSQLNETTGTVTLRGAVANPKPNGGTRLMSPGMFVRVRMPLGQPHAALLVIDRAVGTDQGLKYVYVVDANDTVGYRRVAIGALEEDGLRVINSGLKPNERVLVGGIQQARPKMNIRPDLVPMPTLVPAKRPAAAE